MCRGAARVFQDCIHSMGERLCKQKVKQKVFGICLNKRDIRMSLTQLCVFSQLLVQGAFGVDPDEVKSVMEGESVTLDTDLTEIQTDDQILWLFGPQGMRIAEMYYQTPYTYDETGRLRINNQTGSLTITDTRTSNAGLYKLEIINSRETSYRRFNVTVSVRLPISITNQTQPLNNTRVCKTCPDETGSRRSHVCAISAAAVWMVLMVFTMIVVAV